MIINERVSDRISKSHIRSGVIKRVVGNFVYVQEHGGSSIRAIPPGDIDIATMQPGDSVLLHSDGSNLRVISVYGPTVSHGAQISPTRQVIRTAPSGSGGAVNAIPVSSNVNITGNDGILVTTNLDTGEIEIGYSGASNYSGGDLYGVGSLTFDNGGTLEIVDDHIALTSSKLLSDTQTDDEGWWINSDGTWFFRNRRALKWGPEFTNEYFHWYSATGMPIVLMNDDRVQLGIPGSENVLTVDVEDGLSIHGGTIIAETLDAEAIGPGLSAYLGGIIPEYPMVIDVSDEPSEQSPWDRGIAEDSVSVAMVFNQGLELWVKGGTHGYVDDTKIFDMGLEGVTIGTESDSIELTPEGNLTVPADAFVGGTLQAGERVLIGSGEYGVDFVGIAIDADWGILGLAGGDTWQFNQGWGTYQVRIDRATGKIYGGQGAVEIGADGIVFNQVGDEEAALISWYNDDEDLRLTIGVDDNEHASIWMTDDTDTVELLLGVTETSLQSSAGTEFKFATHLGGGHSFWVGGFPIVQISDALINLGTNTRIFNAEFTRDGLGWGTTTPGAPIEIVDTSAQVRLTSNPEDEIYAELFQDSSQFNLSAYGDIVLNPTDDVLPDRAYSVSLGSPQKKFASIHAGELVVDTLVSSDVRATVSGRLITAPSTTLVFDLPSAQTVIYTYHNEAVVDDNLHMEAQGNMEWMRVTAGPTTRTSAEYGTYYEYSVTRNTDATGANDWLAGDTLVNTGQAGVGGWIEQYSKENIAGDTAGPTVIGYVREGAAFNAYEERWALGDLDNLYGYGETTWGVGLGDPDASFITIDSTNGIRIHNAEWGVVGQWDTDGIFTMYDDAGLLRFSVTPETGETYLRGEIVIESGSSGISNLTDAGDLATQDSVEWADVEGVTGVNLLDPTVWTLGSAGSITGWSNIGDDSENDIVMGDGPLGSETILWRVTPIQDDGAANGGWSTSGFTIDPDKGYRFSVYVKRMGDLADGSVYLGPGPTGETSAVEHVGDNEPSWVDGDQDTNPYFYHQSVDELDTWYLIVGYIFPQGHTGTDSAGGVWNCETGEKIAEADRTFRWTGIYTLVQQRVYEFYANDSTSIVYFHQPRIDEMNGGEPSIAALLGDGALNNQNQDWVDVSGTDRPDDNADVTDDQFTNDLGDIDDATDRTLVGMDASGNLVTAVLPGENVGTPAGEGLYLGADFLGFYDETIGWMTYMDNTGDFFLKGAAGNHFWWDASLENLHAAGWRLSTTSFTSASNNMIISSEGWIETDSETNDSLHIGHVSEHPDWLMWNKSSPNTASFKLDKYGKLWASNVDVQGIIKADTFTGNNGYLSGFALASGTMTGQGGSLVIDSANDQVRYDNIYIDSTGINAVSGVGLLPINVPVNVSTTSLLPFKVTASGSPVFQVYNNQVVSIVTIKTSNSAGIDIDGDIQHRGDNVGFFNVTPTTRPADSADIKDALVSLGLLQGTNATPLDLDGGKLTCGELWPSGYAQLQGADFLGNVHFQGGVEIDGALQQDGEATFRNYALNANAGLSIIGNTISSGNASFDNYIKSYTYVEAPYYKVLSNAGQSTTVTTNDGKTLTFQGGILTGVAGP